MRDAVPGWGAWTLDPGVIAAVVLTAAGYTACWRRAHGRTGRRYPRQTVAFTSGLAVVALALLSPLDEIGDRWLLSAHMLQHVLLADIAPALLVLGTGPPLLAHGLPPQLLRALAPRARLGRLLRHPRLGVIVLGLWAATQWGWSIPAVFDSAAAHPYLHAIEHLSLLASGLLLWIVVVDPLPGQGRRATWSRLGYLGASRAVAAVVCLPLTWWGTTLYTRYAERTARLRALGAGRPAACGRRDVPDRVPRLRPRIHRRILGSTRPRGSRHAADRPRLPEPPAHAWGAPDQRPLMPTSPPPPSPTTGPAADPAGTRPAHRHPSADHQIVGLITLFTAAILVVVGAVWALSAVGGWWMFALAVTVHLLATTVVLAEVAAFMTDQSLTGAAIERVAARRRARRKPRAAP